jgi:hypothetical protein
MRVERHQMQELPPTAMVFTHATANGRRIQLVDANPGIMTLPTAHTLEYEEYEQAVRDQAVLDPDTRDPAVRDQAVRDPAVHEGRPVIGPFGDPVPVTEARVSWPDGDLPSAPPPRARHAAPRGTAPGPASTPPDPVAPPPGGRHARRKPVVPPSGPIEPS